MSPGTKPWSPSSCTVGGSRRIDTRAPVDLNGGGEVGEVVDECGVDDAVGRGCRRTKTVEVCQVAAVHLGAGGRDGCGTLVRAGQADDVVARADEFADDCRADETAG